MSRSNHQLEPEPPKRQPKLIQPELTNPDQPQTATVDGTGLLEWCRRSRTGEVFIFRMLVKQPGIYTLSLQWP